MNIDEARRAIGKVLAELERDTGSVVREISLAGVEVTTIESNGCEIAMIVHIELERLRLPGHQWYVGDEA